MAASEKQEGLASATERLTRRVAGNNVWLYQAGTAAGTRVDRLSPRPITPEVLLTEEAVAKAMVSELEEAARSRTGDLVVVILGGRGGQAMHRLLGEMARTGEADHLLTRLRLFTQDALAPLPMRSPLSFVRDFERSLGDDFFRKVKSFTSMRTDVDGLEGALSSYANELLASGDIDICFLGLGPEAGGASHLAYIKPGSGAAAHDFAGIIPVSSSILEHHIAKFKAGGISVNREDEAECRAATHILTLGPAAILNAKKIVQSIVDAGTAPAKRECYRQVLETEISADRVERAAQLDRNPGLWLRLHPNVRSLVLPDVLGC
jgi:6-phosphogluconolactonase/glucosamine-6-phosphate isomerase/deaminase